jgi:hypothetical protein
MRGQHCVSSVWCRYLSFRSPRVRRFKRLIALPDVNVEVRLLNCCREMLLRGCSTGAKVGLGFGKALQNKGLRAPCHSILWFVEFSGGYVVAAPF